MKKIQLADAIVKNQLQRVKKAEAAVAENPAAVKKARAAVKATQQQIAQAAVSVHSTHLDLKRQLAIIIKAAKDAKGTGAEAAVNHSRTAVEKMVATVAGVSL